MASILRNEEQLSQLSHEGYTTFRLIPEHICSSLLEFYRQHSYEDESVARGFSTGLDQIDKSNSIACSQEIVRQIDPYIKEQIKSYQVIISTFIVKKSGMHNISPLHQDWTFVDERKYCSYTLWCPLHDVGLENGALGLLPKSHRILGHVARPSPCPPYVPVFSKSMMEIFPYLRFFSLSAGEAILFDHRCWHGAMPNLDPRPRVAIGISIAHKDAALEHHYLLPNSSRATILKVDKGFFYTYNNEELLRLHQSGALPSGYEQCDSYEFKYPELNEEEFLQSLRTESTPNQEVRIRIEALKSTQHAEPPK